MSRMRVILSRLMVLVVALAVPAGGLLLWTGQRPAAFDVATLNAWAPIRDAGPSAQGLAALLTRIIGPGHAEPPSWFTIDDQEQLARAEAALRANKLQQGLGHLMVLSGRLEERGKTLADFMPLVAPEIATWLVASYFAPVLLGILLLVFGFLTAAPWLARRLVDALKLLIGLGTGIIAVGLAVGLSFTIAGQRALVFTLIEYLTAVVILAGLGNLLLLLRRHRQAHRALSRHRQQPGALPPVAGGALKPQISPSGQLSPAESAAGAKAVEVARQNHLKGSR